MDLNVRDDSRIFMKTFYMTGYKKLAVWQKQYPKEEMFSLTSQTKRAAISIPANITEGCGRRTKKDTLQFLCISRGSLYELETHLNIAVMIEILSEEKFAAVSALIDECLKILNGLINKYETDKSLQ